MTGIGYKRGKGTVNKSFSWRVDDLDVLDEIEKLSGRRGLSTLVQELLKGWREQQQAIIQDNPIGLRYNSTAAASAATRHWIDAMLDKPIDKLKEDVQKIEDLDLLAKISIIALRINEAANSRAQVVRQKNSGRVIREALR